MRITSLTKQVRLVVLLAAFCVPGLAAPAHGAKTDAAPGNTIPQAGSSQVSQAAGVPQAPQIATSQHMKGDAARRDVQVSKADMLPEPATLLPIAAVVGFSFLFGGIVCTLKTRP